jgi:hypothetical protein
MSVTNNITLAFTSNRPLTSAEQEALLVQIELAITEPQVWTEHGHEDADWELVGHFGLTAEFPVITSALNERR